jgi:hypothetical protein
VNEIFIPGYRDESRIFKQVLAHFDAPAYVRRARRVEEALQALLEHCRRRRERALRPVRRHLRLLEKMTGGWDALPSLLCDQQALTTLRRLHDEQVPAVQTSVRPAASGRTLRRAVAGLNASIDGFNRNWTGFMEQLDLDPVNEARAGYNRYYVLEKECAVRSLQVARQGFRPLPPLTRADLENLFPCLPVLELKA